LTYELIINGKFAHGSNTFILGDNAPKKIVHAQEHTATNGNMVRTADALFLTLLLKSLCRLEVAQRWCEFIH